MDVREATLRDDDLFDADEAFLTGTTREVVPIVTVNDRTIGSGPARPGDAERCSTPSADRSGESSDHHSRACDHGRPGGRSRSRCSQRWRFATSASPISSPTRSISCRSSKRCFAWSRRVCWGARCREPTARALGPFGAIVFGVPVALGFGINAIHGLTSIFLVLAAALAFWQLARLDRTMAWAWLIVFTAMRMVWWNAAMFWVNTLLLPLGLLQLALFTAILRNPTSLKVTSMTLVLALALHVHLVALVGLPFLVLALVVSSRRGVRETESAPRGVAHVIVALLLVAAVVPYAAAEGQTDFRNTRAIVSHVDTTVRSGVEQGRSAALETLVLATDPASAAPAAPATTVIGAGAIVAFVALLLALVRRTRAASAEEHRRMDRFSG